MDLIATDGPSKGGWPRSGGVRPAGDGQDVELDTNRVSIVTLKETKRAYEQKLVWVEVHCLWIYPPYDGLRYYP